MRYVVLGMHKSGTSLLTEMLHRSGIYMTSDTGGTLQYDEGKTFECPQARTINLRLLGWSRNTHSRKGVPPKRLRFERNRQAMKSLVAQRDAQGWDWGFKDPRTCLTYPAWDAVLPEHRLIAIYRHPAQICRHYRARGIYRTAQVLRMWVLYNRHLLRILQTTAHEFVLLSYERLMSAENELEQLRTLTNRPLVDVRDPRQFRRRETDNPLVRQVDSARRWMGKVAAMEVFQMLEEQRNRAVLT